MSRVELRTVLNDDDTFSNTLGTYVYTLPSGRYPADSLRADWGHAEEDEEVRLYHLCDPDDLRALADYIERNEVTV